MKKIYIRIDVLVIMMVVLAGSALFLGKVVYSGDGLPPKNVEEVKPVVDAPGGDIAVLEIRSRLFSELRQGEFLGLELRDSDFLIPLNRLIFTGHVVVDDPKADYGTAGGPTNLMLFKVAENGDEHSFIVWGAQEKAVDVSGELKYLGKNIDIQKVGDGADGSYEILYKSEGSEEINRCGMMASEVGALPDPDVGIVQPLVMDKRAVMADSVDTRYFENLSIETMFTRFQEAVRSDNRDIVVEYFQYPIAFANEMYFTKKGLLTIYDKIFTEKRKQVIVNSTVEDIFKRGPYAELPGSFFCYEVHDASPIYLMHDSTFYK